MAGRRGDAEGAASDAADARVRFSAEILREHYGGRGDGDVAARASSDGVHPRRAHTLPPLYTIPSHVEPASQPGVSAGRSDDASITSGPRRRHLHDGDDHGPPRSSFAWQSRRSGVSFAEPLPPPGRGGRGRLDDNELDSLDGSGKAVASLAMAPSSAPRIGRDTSDTLAHYRDWLDRQRDRQRRWTTGPYGRLKEKAAAAYHTYILEGLLRQRPLPPSADGRHVPLDPGRVRMTPLPDERRGRPFISNFIRSSRYTVWDFLPKQLVFQFMKLANFYFLIISVLQMIPGLSTTGTYTTIIPLLFFVAISMGKEGFDDYRRYRLDRIENRSIAYVLDPGHTVQAQAEKRRRAERSRSVRWSQWPKEKHRQRGGGGGGSSGAAAVEMMRVTSNDGLLSRTAATGTSKGHANTEVIETDAGPAGIGGSSRSGGGNQHARFESDATFSTLAPTSTGATAAAAADSAAAEAEATANADEAALKRMPWSAVTWQELRVGDIVRLRRDDSVPADMVLLHASGPNGIAYIETMALDGETNLKTKQASPKVAEHCTSLAAMAACGAEFVSEDPNMDLYNYEGRVILNGETLPLNLNQIVFRGSVVRNTAETIGLVVNTGEECKIRMNAHRHKSAKAPAMQFLVNRIVLLLVVFVVLLAVGCSIGNGLWLPHFANKAWYLDHASLPLTQILFAFVIMFNTLIPLSLYVSLEIIKVGQLYLLGDVEMYDADTDTPMVANTTTILENLGQVSYIFSDKTGTLTENKMRFRKMSVAGTAWLHDMDLVRDAEEKEQRARARLRDRQRAKGKKKAAAAVRRSLSMARVSFQQAAHPAAAPVLTDNDADDGDNDDAPSQDLASPIAVRDFGAAAAAAAPPADTPRRSMSTTAHWRSSARPTRAPPERKTEEFLQYIRHRPHTAFSRKARHFLLCIALCHTCLPETTASGAIAFQAASPDELALVLAAQDLGYLLVDRPAQSVKLQFHQLDGTLVTETYQVLDVIEFSSKRKRMSIVIRMPDGRLCLFCKGADSVILPRLKLNQMALAKASAVERRASKRKSVEQERAMLLRRSLTTSLSGGGGVGGVPGVVGVGGAGGAATPRSSANLVRAASAAAAIHAPAFRGIARKSTGKRSMDTAYRRSAVFSGEVDGWLRRREREDMDLVDAVERQDSGLSAATAPAEGSGEGSGSGSGSGSSSSAAAAVGRRSGLGRRSLDAGATTAVSAAAAAAAESLYTDPYSGLVDETIAANEGAVFDRCFQHIDDFASEGLRTLLFAYRYLEEDDYRKWRVLYQDATTSLVNRQERVEAAADLLEQGFDLAGATAIEDKLQQGVPETVDKMRRANIKIWMLTGDKRETAVNIAHAARICKPYSEVYVLDATVDGDGLQERIASTLVDVSRGMMPHSVVVIDGHTLGVVEEEEEMRILFFDLVARVDAVICCRASPAQKATLVKCIRQRVPSSLTLAIGDGANDIAMIQASHVGIGISGREGLQAARIADYSIAQFRFLQRLLLVHGRWNYARTGKYILGTFWKEMLFYLVQALFQHNNGYTGTSLYESTSLTVFNTLFTSLPVILLGMFEKDLRAETLLAVPELYTYGQRNRGFCFRLYVGWMAMAVVEAAAIYFILYAVYSKMLFTDDASLYAMGSVAFSVCVTFVNLKMLFIELHNQTIISAIGLLVSVGGWFMWSILLSLVYGEKSGPYLVHGTFLHNFGRTATWWATLALALVVVVAFELLVRGIRRTYFPTDLDLMQLIEHDQDVRAVFAEHAAEQGEAGVGGAAAAGSSRYSSSGVDEPYARPSYSSSRMGGGTASAAGAGDHGTRATDASSAAPGPALRKPQIPALDTTSRHWLGGSGGGGGDRSSPVLYASPVETTAPVGAERLRED